jgi:DNA-directed RNA polymerase specialized sigma24 family protein
MTEFLGAAREKFWCEMIVGFDRRIRAYCETTRCDPSEVEQIVWDLWDEATSHETRLMESQDRWAILLALLRPLCARRVTVARRELHYLTEPPDDAGYAGDDRHAHLEKLTEWAMEQLHKLPHKQRIAVDFRYRWKMPYWAIAAGIETEESTARVHVTRGVRTLRALAKELPDGIDAGDSSK